MSDRRPHRFPKFESADEERVHLKQRMAAAFRLFDRFGFNEGVAGHLTGRDPEHADRFWVNPLRARSSTATGR
jgi:ribulose-5-phosphate 4-epimerase/fuculose-1-phosphate aldolase